MKNFDEMQTEEEREKTERMWRCTQIRVIARELEREELITPEEKIALLRLLWESVV
ncbi:MAG: hypothetical protein SOT28_02295 [Fusicatenibacter sp.]|nr:hypothetical protein [Lachnospiraceae bacterium]MDY2937137.1 hypothetical protein [Fusicatenibacter sp.]